MVNKLVLLKGNVNYVSKSQTRIVESVHFCEKTGQFTQKVYFDAFKLQGLREQDRAQTNEVPIKDKADNPISFEHGLSRFSDFQVAGVQESTENVPTGMLSRTIEVYL